MIPLLGYRFGIAPAISLSVGWCTYGPRPTVAAYQDSERSGPPDSSSSCSSSPPAG